MLKTGTKNIKLTLREPESIISDIHKLILHGKKDSTLFQKVCGEIQRIGDYRFVWIGLLNGIKAGIRTIDPIASYGPDIIKKNTEDILLNESKIIEELSELPIRSKNHIILNLDDSKTGLSLPLRSIMKKSGINSLMVVSLKYNNNVVGLLNVFSGINGFTRKEVKALLEVSKNISTDTRGMKLEIELKNTMKQLQRALYETIDAITLMSEIKDPYTSGHQKKVALLASAISEELGLSKDTIDGIYVSGLLHDVGKISVPNDILAKPGQLSEGEFIIVKNHPLVSYNILKNIEFPWSIADIVRQHHEKMDGSGYPGGLSGNDICIEAKILAVADVVEAMTAHRPYRPALGLKKAVAEIKRYINIFYDKEIVEACIKAIHKGKIKL